MSSADATTLTVTPNWIRWMHWFEGWAMLLTGPFLMVFGEYTLGLWGVNVRAMSLAASSSSAAAVAAAVADIAGLSIGQFGALVFLMGWIEVRYHGLLPRYCVEAWLIADILYLIVFLLLIVRYGEFNFWSIWGTAAWPASYAPVRCYWLWLNPARQPVKLE